MLATMAASLLGLLLLGLVNGSAQGDVVHLLCTASAIVLVIFRLRDEAKLEAVADATAPRAAERRVSPHGAEVRTGEITPA